MLPTPRFPEDVQRTLDALAESRMLSPAREAGYELRLVGATVLPQQETITRTPWGTWKFVDHLNDPTAAEYGGDIPFPVDQLARLNDLSRVGVQPELVWTAHELPATYREGDPLPPLVPAPPKLREMDERLQRRLAAVAAWLLKGTAAALTAAVAPVAMGSAAVASVGLDPIILGGVQHPVHPVVTWCVLAQWDWE